PFTEGHAGVRAIEQCTQKSRDAFCTPQGPARLRATDAVEKSLAIIGFAIGGRFRPLPGRALPPDRRTPELTCQASYAIDAHTRSVGGPRRRSAIVLRFCTIAARGNSSRAPVRPRKRIRSKPCWTFRCAKRISTFLRALLDRSNSGVPFSERA